MSGDSTLGSPRSSSPVSSSRVLSATRGGLPTRRISTTTRTPTIRRPQNFRRCGTQPRRSPTATPCLDLKLPRLLLPHRAATTVHELATRLSLTPPSPLPTRTSSPLRSLHQRQHRTASLRMSTPARSPETFPSESTLRLSLARATLFPRQVGQRTCISNISSPRCWNNRGPTRASTPSHLTTSISRSTSSRNPRRRPSGGLTSHLCSTCVLHTIRVLSRTSMPPPPPRLLAANIRRRHTALRSATPSTVFLLPHPLRLLQYHLILHHVPLHLAQRPCATLTATAANIQPTQVPATTTTTITNSSR
jgi:hypothetical protein